MSRIERALEIAAKMRDSHATPGTGTGVQLKAEPGRGFDPSVFEAQDGGVDSSAVDRHIVSITDPYSFAAEEYRKLRARLLKSTKKQFHNTLMVTSALQGEGKTVTAVNLAVTLAREVDHTVLLVDADLRSPSIHTYLGIQPEHGLSDYLASRLDLSAIMIKTGIGKLVFLPAGKPPENPAELINSSRMQAMVTELKERYRDRYVIIDTMPLLAAADSLSLCAYVDGVVLIAQAGRTDQKTAMQALSLIQDYNVLGVVLNKTEKHPDQGSYAYYYRSGAASGATGGDSGYDGAPDRARKKA